MSESKEVKHVVVKTSQNSFEFGPAKKRHKVYYEDATDLHKKLGDLKTALEINKDVVNWLTGDLE